MKRANEHSALPGTIPVVVEPASNLRTGQRPVASTTLIAASPGNRPNMAGRTDRIGTAMAPETSEFMFRHSVRSVHLILSPDALPPPPPRFTPPMANRASPGPSARRMPVPSDAAPRQPGAGPASPAGRQGNGNVFEDNALLVRIKALIAEDFHVWMKNALLLKGQEKTDFLIASLYEVVRKLGWNPGWHVGLNFIMNNVGMDVLLAQKWPDDRALVSLLTGIKANQWLDQALLRGEGQRSLFVRDKTGTAPLDVAVMAGNKKAVRSILAFDDDAGTLRTSQNPRKFIALHNMCGYIKDPIVALLLERKGREQRLSANDAGVLPIHAALFAGIGAGALPRLLAECAEEQTLAQTIDGINALMLAAANGPASAVTALLAVKGTLARQLEARDSKGNRAIYHARDSGNAEIIRLIEAAMKKPPSASSSATPSTTTRMTALYGLPYRGNERPVPLTPCPPTAVVVEDPGISDTEDEPSRQ